MARGNFEGEGAVHCKSQTRCGHLRDAVYCYQLSSEVCQSACQFVCHANEPCKMAEPIEAPFGFRNGVGPENHILDWGPDPPWEGAILRGKSGLL